LARRLSALIVAALAALALCASAQAQITLGQQAPPSPPAICSGPPAEVIQIATSTAPNPYVVPVSGLITSWSTNAAAGAGQTFKLKIFRQVVGTTYTVVAQDGPRPLTPSALNTFAVSIPVQAGDLIGINDQNAEAAPNACLFTTESITDVYGAAVGDTPTGGSISLPPILSGFRVNVAATLKPPPTIAAIAPAAGSIKGGAVVTILGTDLGAATGVRFGANPAAGFTVVSDGQITAIAPPASGPGAVPVTVSTAAGTSPATAAAFTYTACVVPKLTGKKLKGAKKRIRKAGCKVGTVKKLGGATAKTGVVVKQNPKAGKVLAPGAKVSVKLGA
jgi:hypothetical protein